MNLVLLFLRLLRLLAANVLKSELFQHPVNPVNPVKKAVCRSFARFKAFPPRLPRLSSLTRQDRFLLALDSFCPTFWVILKRKKAVPGKRFPGSSPGPPFMNAVNSNDTGAIRLSLSGAERWAHPADASGAPTCSRLRTSDLHTGATGTTVPPKPTASRRSARRLCLAGGHP
jgi:hypothetical protein